MLQSPLVTVIFRLKTHRVSTYQVRLECNQRAAMRLVEEGGYRIGYLSHSSTGR